MISILLVDDHPIVRSGIKLLINSQLDMEVKYEAKDGEEAVHKALTFNPDLVIMDINMPKKNGILSTKQIHEVDKNIKVIMLTMHDEKEYIIRALQAGALGYILKSDNEHHLIDAIRIVHSGNTYLHQTATTFLLEHYVQHFNRTTDEDPSILTGREEEILTLLAKGYTNREISELLFISIKTVESCKSKMMEKLNLKLRKDIIRYAAKHKLLIFT